MYVYCCRVPPGIIVRLDWLVITAAGVAGPVAGVAGVRGWGGGCGMAWHGGCVDLVFIIPLQAARRAMAAVMGFSIYHKKFLADRPNRSLWPPLTRWHGGYGGHSGSYIWDGWLTARIIYVWDNRYSAVDGKRYVLSHTESCNTFSRS